MTTNTADAAATLTDQLRAALQSDGRTSHELAAKAGVHRGQLYRFLRGQRGLHIDTIDRLWSAMGLRLARPRKRA